MHSLLLSLSLFGLATPIAQEHDHAQCEEPHQEVAQAAPLTEADEFARAGAELLQSGQFEAALAPLRRALELRRDELGPQDPQVLMSFNNLCFGQLRAGALEDAIHTGEEGLALAIAAAGEGGASEATAGLRRLLAECHERRGHIGSAREAMQAACQDFLATYGPTPITAQAAEAVGRLARMTGDLRTAQHHLELAVSIQERQFGPANPKVARPLASLASVLADRGQLDAALLLLEHVEQRLAVQPTGNDEGLASVLRGQSELLARLGESEIAREKVAQLIADPEIAQSAPIESFPYLMDVLEERIRLGDSEASLELLQPMIDRLREAEASADTKAIALGLLAESLFVSERFEEALTAAEDSLSQLTDEEAQAGELATLNHLVQGRAAYRLGRFDEALTSLMRALDARRDALGQRHSLLIEPFLALIELEHRSKGNTRGLRDLLDMVEIPIAQTAPLRLAAIERRFRQHRGRSLASAWTEAQLQVAKEQDGWTEKLGFEALDRQRERDLIEPLAWWLHSGAIEADSNVAQYLEVLRRLEAPVTDPQQRLSLAGELETARRALLDSNSQWRDVLLPQGATLAQARSLLNGNDERVLLYSWTGRELWAMVVDASENEVRPQKLGATRDLLPRLSEAQTALRDSTQPCDLTALSQAVLHPLWDELAGASKVYVIADGPLAYLPFEALPAPDERFWVESAELRYAPSVASLVRLRRQAADRMSDADRRAGAADETTEATLAGLLRLEDPLPHPRELRNHQLIRLNDRFLRNPMHSAPTISEPNGIDSLWSGAELTEARIKAASREDALQGYSVLHLGLPTFIDANAPAASGIATSPEASEMRLPIWRKENGYLDLAEIRGLDLKTNLAVLSRAELGPQPQAHDLRSSGVFALVQSLWAAGAQGIALSSWTSEEPQAQQFLQRYLQITREADPPGALNRAQREWLQHARSSNARDNMHPAHWAAMRYFGL